MWVLSVSHPPVCQTWSAPVVPRPPCLRLLPFAHRRRLSAARVFTAPTWYTQLITCTCWSKVLMAAGYLPTIYSHCLFIHCLFVLENSGMGFINSNLFWNCPKLSSYSSKSRLPPDGGHRDSGQMSVCFCPCS